MSDITIPGITSKYNTDKIIEGLMKLERIPLTKMEDRQSTYSEQKDVWLEISKKLSTLRDSAKALYGFQNPFQEHTVTSSDEAVLTASATRDAEKKTQQVDVKQIASSDRFLSGSMKRDYTVPPGKYGFSIGNEVVEIAFKGGKLESFAEQINKKGKDLISASVINDTADTSVLLIESLKSGEKNTLELKDDALSFGLEAGLLKKGDSAEYTFPLTLDSVRPWTKPLGDDLYSLSEGTLELLPGGEVSLPSAASFADNSNLVLEITVKIKDLKVDNGPPSSPPAGPDLSSVGHVEYEGIVIKNLPSSIELPPWVPPAAPKARRDMSVIFLQGSSSPLPAPDLSNSPTQTLRLRLSDYVKQLTSLNLRNNNTDMEFIFSNIRIFDPDSRGDYTPAHPVDTAKNSIISLGGIIVKRDTNKIDDLLPGITLNLHGKSEKPVTIKVGPDKDVIKSNVIKFVGYYNQLLSKLQILTSRNASVIEEIDYLTDDEKNKAKDQLGLFQGDITLMNLKARLQQIMMAPYETRDGRDLTLLSQMGISTNTSASGSMGVDSTKLRGYLEIDENKLDSAISDHSEAMKDFFGSDSDGDLINDTGLAFLIDNHVNGYVKTGGLIPIKIQTLDQQLKNINNDIDNYNVRLAEKEQTLREKYGKMEGALSDLQKTSSQIDNFNTQNSGN